LVIISLLTTTNVVLAQSNSVCRAITFSGAGDRGAYEVGVAAGLVTIREPQDFRWQIATGISAGAINTAGMAMFAIGKEEDAVQFLVNQWEDVSRKRIYVLENLYNASMVAQSNRTVLIGATSYDTGLFTKFTNTADPDIVLMVKASASIPALFEPTNIRGTLYMDGGATYLTPVTDTAELCAQTGAEKTIIDAVIIGKPDSTVNVTTWKTPALLMRSADIVMTNIFMKDIETAFQAYPNIIINLYYPSQPLPGDFLGFQYSKEMISIGIKDATSESPSLVTLDIGNYKEALATLR
ncbi:hypothetical protein SAMD00019534_010140, partial [Acytostelium subglobosum LB1]|uniref:hypothetical protein n=1 Tax=Acytostelium subglobosum LB1 TaxID=1410327 RepID=UPI000644D435